jgi:hypothetical protein
VVALEKEGEVVCRVLGCVVLGRAEGGRWDEKRLTSKLCTLFFVEG